MSCFPLTRTCLAAWFAASLLIAPLGAANYYVSNAGINSSGRDGSESQPWATMEYALSRVAAGGGDTILVKPGLYTGRTSLDRRFPAHNPVTLRSEIPYQARLRNSDVVLTIYAGQGLVIEGFDIAHSGAGAAPLVIQVQDESGFVDEDNNGLDDEPTRDITFRNNILHDSWNNDILKINNAASHVLVEGNLFYNQGDSDEHIDINSVRDVVVRRNVFFNDFVGSGRAITGGSSSYIVIKDSNNLDDNIETTEDITVEGNVFLHWEGSAGSNFVLCGEDGKAYYEARNVLIQNNLMLGDGTVGIRAPFGVKGSADIIFRHNTLTGNMPGNAFAFRLNREGSNLQVSNVQIYHNVWSDPTGTMDDFSDTLSEDIASYTLQRNLYWNGGSAIPSSGSDHINYTNDPTRITGSDPLLPSLSALVLPRWVEASGQFAEGSLTIEAVFRRLVRLYGRPAPGSALVDAADVAGQSPATDILGNPRTVGAAPDLGAFEVGSDCPDFADWIAGPGIGIFPGEDDPLIISAAADPETDALANGQEYALAAENPGGAGLPVIPLSPQNSSIQLLPVAQKVGDELRLTLIRRTTARHPWLNLEVEFAAELGSGTGEWSAPAVTQDAPVVLPQSPCFERVTYRATLAPGAASGYLRIRAELEEAE